jgi:hypothetical protein
MENLKGTDNGMDWPETSGGNGGKGETRLNKATASSSNRLCPELDSRRGEVTVPSLKTTKLTTATPVS